MPPDQAATRTSKRALQSTLTPADLEPAPASRHPTRRGRPQKPVSKTAADRTKWCKGCHISGHFLHRGCKDRKSERCFSGVATAWSQYYRPEGLQDVLNPTTLIQVKNIIHDMAMHFNSFDAFLKEQDGFLLEVDTYLQRLLGSQAPDLWQGFRGMCDNVMMTYLINLQVFVKNTQKHVVHSTIMEVAFVKGTGTTPYNSRSLKLDSVDELAQVL